MIQMRIHCNNTKVILQAGMGEGSNDEWGTAGKDWEWDDGTDEEAEKKKKEEQEKQEQEEKEKKRLKEKSEAEERRLKEEEEERVRRAAEEEAMLEAARLAKEAEAAALRETLGEDDRVKFDEMVSICLYLLLHNLEISLCSILLYALRWAGECC